MSKKTNHQRTCIDVSAAICLLDEYAVCAQRVSAAGTGSKRCPNRYLSNLVQKKSILVALLTGRTPPFEAEDKVIAPNGCSAIDNYGATIAVRNNQWYTVRRPWYDHETDTWTVELKEVGGDVRTVKFSAEAFVLKVAAEAAKAA